MFKGLVGDGQAPILAGLTVVDANVHLEGGGELAFDRAGVSVLFGLGLARGAFGRGLGDPLGLAHRQAPLGDAAGEVGSAGMAN